MSTHQQIRFAAIGLIAIAVILGYFQTGLNGDVRPVVLQGQPVPGVPNARFDGFRSASVNVSGDIAFYAGYRIGDTVDGGIFKVVSGVLTPVALRGRKLPDDPT